MSDIGFNKDWSDSRRFDPIRPPAQMTGVEFEKHMKLVGAGIRKLADAGIKDKIPTSPEVFFAEVKRRLKVAKDEAALRYDARWAKAEPQERAKLHHLTAQSLKGLFSDYTHDELLFIFSGLAADMIMGQVT